MIEAEMEFDAQRYERNGSYNSTHKDEYSSGSGEYLIHETEPKDHLNNSENLFDDSNSKDRKWLKSAKMYLLAKKR